MAIRRRWSVEQRHGAMAAHAQSGVSLWAFAKTSGIGYTTLTHWRDLARAGAAPRLVPVKIAEPKRATLTTATSGSAVEVLVGGAVVRVSADFNDAVLLRVMRVLRAC